MAKFVFKLQNYLSLKEKLEDQKKLEYATALSQLEKEKRKRAAMVRERGKAVSRYREEMKKKISPQALQRHNIYVDLLKKKIAKQTEVVEEGKKAAEAKRLALVEAMKERKMLDTLKDKERVNFNREEQLREQKIVDEIVSFQYSNR